jgi:N-acetylglucosaminyldiphosphoundecaprenol N-acetyl-beta-D-mannosaminyltransferase
MPLQERWLHDHWHLINVPVAITAGALVDHAAGHVRRPPRWVANLGLEWAVRLVIEPKRLWRRYLLGLPVFVACVLTHTIARRWGAAFRRIDT